MPQYSTSRNIKRSAVSNKAVNMHKYSMVFLLCVVAMVVTVQAKPSPCGYNGCPGETNVGNGEWNTNDVTMKRGGRGGTTNVGNGSHNHNKVDMK